MVQLPDFNRGVLEGLGLAGDADVLNPRSLASAVSPALSGALLSTSFAGLPLVVCGQADTGLAQKMPVRAGCRASDPP
jgi:hypothetical protein